MGSLTPEQIDAAIEGEREAVEAFTKAYLPRVFALSLRLCRNHGMAEEATQETFVRALRALPRLRAPERLTSWILTIAANTTREVARKSQRTSSLEWEPAAIEPERDEASEVKQKALDLALASLGNDERELFLLHAIEGVRLKTLAEEHEVSVGAMKSRVHRIRSKVRVKALEVIESVGALP